MLALADTAEMPAWTLDDDAPEGFYTWGSYTSLGPYVPAWSNPITVQERRDHTGRHNVKARWGSLRKWARNALREVGDYFVGEFQTA